MLLKQLDIFPAGIFSSGVAIDKWGITCGAFECTKRPICAEMLACFIKITTSSFWLPFV